MQLATKIHYYDFGIFRLDVTNCELLKDGEHIALTLKSFEILHFLIQNRGRMLKKEDILEVIWTDSFVEEANLAQHIYMIRKALKDCGDDNNYIETIPKYGYRFVGEVTEGSISPDDFHRSFQPNNSIVRSNRFEADLEEDLPQNKYELPESLPELTQRKHHLLIPNIIIATIFAILISAFIYFVYFSASEKKSDISSIRSISILPFKQIGGGKDEQLGLGLADTLISRLSNQNRISILPTTTIAKFADTESVDLIELGEKLEVDAILTGTIQKENDIIRVNVQLISVNDRSTLWTDKFDAEFSEIFTLQDKVSEQLAHKLSLPIEDSEQIKINVQNTKNAEAFREYSLGISFWNDRTSENLPKAIEHFENAIAKDANFAPAYSHLADTYSLVGYYKLKDIMSPEEAIEKANKMAEKALELDAGSSEAYAALAMIALYEDNYEKATKFYRKAIELKPDNATAHQRLAWMLTTNDNLKEAIKEMRLAQKADSQSQLINTNLARLLRLNRQTDEALSYCKKAVEIDPSNILTKVILAEIYEQKGLLDKSIEELKAIPKNAPEEKTAKLLLSRVYAKKGEKKTARKILNEATKIESKEETPSYEVATIYTHLGEKKEAVKKLQTATDNSLLYFLHLKYDYNIDPLRDSPEYTKILSKSKNKFIKSTEKKS